LAEKSLERRADVNAQGGYYGNPLHAASLRSHEKVVKMLSENGAYSQSLGGLQLSD
jgi:ankyrin repeat protein